MTTLEPVDIPVDQLNRRTATTMDVWQSWWEDHCWDGDALYVSLDAGMWGAAADYVDAEYPHPDGSPDDELPQPTLQWRPTHGGSRWGLYDHGEDTGVVLTRMGVQGAEDYDPYADDMRAERDYGIPADDDPDED